MQSYECVIISKMFLIYFISYGCNDSALVFLGGAEASASPSFALPMFITIKKIIILHLFLGVPAATVGGTGTPWHTRGYAPGSRNSFGLQKKAACKCFFSHRFYTKDSILWEHDHKTWEWMRRECCYFEVLLFCLGFAGSNPKFLICICRDVH